ncbi:YeeE/YedE family protein [Ramlibacter ginsenosidimutans]|uniref:YeeE/YedE family protein n=1 Tax=Ramlibacter ginsenosidimutans TaxID=502333 RepID=A0A934TT01_9BURK|nr:YeeE/YedE family protein [Ramlibacter ginsenosidimutans]MBK6006823.1 YeeE/YedE family protein [Ramlibacter ginsenosidimutans]
MTVFFSLLAGALFGVGLIVSGMADPAKVLGFLDLGGAWNPSLAFVMVGAIAVGTLAFAIARKRTLSFLGLPMRLPTERHIDRRLVTGSVLFGVGWGIVGLCPGPALVDLGMGQPKAIIFVIAMVGGMVLFEVVEMLRRPRTAHVR